MIRNIITLLVLVMLSYGCSKKVTSHNISESAEVENMATVRSDKAEKCDCYDPNNYAPDDRFPQFEDIKYVMTNFHYPNASTLNYNYVGEDALKYSLDLIKSCNSKLAKNQKMKLPIGNDTPVYDAGYRYKLAKDETTSSGYAVYEDVDDENWFYIKKGKNKNNYSRTIIKKFARNADKYLNVFAMAYHPDSVARKGFSAGRAGIALGTSLKIAGIMKHGVGGAWRNAAVTNHEIGHIFGLRHSWYKNDGCDDTPPNPNCWDAKQGGDCGEVTSNNMMDYNNQQMAITPCQIGMVRKNMHKETGKTRGLILKDWCDYDESKSLIISEDTNIDRSIDMKGDIIILDGATLRLSCRTHMPSKAKIIVHPEATLFLNGAKIHNDCGDHWGGIELLSKGDQSASIIYQGKVRIMDLKDDPKSEEKMD